MMPGCLTASLKPRNLGNSSGEKNEEDHTCCRTVRCACWSGDCAGGSGSERRPSPGSRFCDHDGKPRIFPDTRESERAFHQRLCKVGEFGDQLLCHSSPQSEQLSGDSRWI